MYVSTGDPLAQEYFQITTDRAFSLGRISVKKNLSLDDTLVYRVGNTKQLSLTVLPAKSDSGIMFCFTKLSGTFNR